MERYFKLLLLISVLTSCEEMESQNDLLLGKIACQTAGYDNKVLIYSHNHKQEFIIPNDSNRTFLNFKWFSDQDIFVSMEYIKPDHSSKKLFGDNYITLIDINGKPLQRIYKFPDKEAIHSFYPSPSGNKIVYIFKIADKKATSITEPAYTLGCIKIVDLKTNSVENIIHDIASLIHIKMFESPWSFDETMIVYAVSYEMQIIVDGEENIVEKIDYKPLPVGLYIYNLETDENQLIIEGSDAGVWSPNGNHIAYKLNDNLYIYDVKNKSSELLYKTGYFESIRYFHWTPDSENIYFKCPHEISWLHYKIDNEKIIRIENKMEVSFKHLKLPPGLYSWKQ